MKCKLSIWFIGQKCVPSKMRTETQKRVGRLALPQTRVWDLSLESPRVLFAFYLSYGHMVKQKQIVLSNILLPVFIYKIYRKLRAEAIWMLPNKAKKKKKKKNRYIYKQTIMDAIIQFLFLHFVILCFQTAVSLSNKFPWKNNL